MRIESVVYRDFAPFANAQLDFPAPKAPGGDVHLFAGENGVGKTRMLTLLAAVCGNGSELWERVKDSPQASAFAAAGLLANARGWELARSRDLSFGYYCDSRPMGLSDEIISNRWPVRPWFESSYRSDGFNLEKRVMDEVPHAALAFKGMATVRDSKVEALKPVSLGDKASHLVFEHDRKDEDAIIGQSMTNIKMQAAMESQGAPPETRKYTRMAARIEEAVGRVTGRAFSFAVTPYPQVGLVVDWGGVKMRLKMLPDGLRSIIGWMVACAAKIDALYPEHQDPLSIPTVLLLDEPESHLHPAWQRKVIPAAQALLPNCQIFAATHSPFLISSVNAGYIHVFRADAAGTVTVDAPRECSPGDSYLDVVEDILGVKEWYDPETEGELERFRGLMEQALGGNWALEEDLRRKAEAIAARSPTLNEMMGREMHQFDRLKAQVEA